MIVTAATATFVVMVVMTTAATFMIVVMMTTATAFMTVMVSMLLFSGTDHGPDLHRSGQCRQFRNQSIRILSRQSQLPGGKGDDRLLHTRMGVEFRFDLGCAIGTIQILNNIYFFQGIASHFLGLHMNNCSYVYFSISYFGFPVKTRNVRR